LPSTQKFAQSPSDVHAFAAHVFALHVKFVVPQSDGCVHGAPEHRWVASHARPGPQSAADEQPGTHSASGTAPPPKQKHGPGFETLLQIIPAPPSTQSLSALQMAGPLRGWQVLLHMGASATTPQKPAPPQSFCVRQSVPLPPSLLDLFVPHAR
jgi:hypothetical protein